MNEKTGRVLIVDDDDVLMAGRLFLKRHVASVQTEKRPENIPALMNSSGFDVILLDMNFTRDASSGQEGFYWLDRILETDPDAVVVLITAYGDIEMAVKAIRKGAVDFVLKPWENENLLGRVSAAIRLRRSRQEVTTLQNRERQLSADMDAPFQGFIGSGPAMKEIKTMIRKVGPTDVDVLILGENGTGKELVARALHRHSPRGDRPFMSVDMGAIPESLFESEMFGHVRGAFTDARTDRVGRLEVASGSTLFLDEIGNLSPASQARMLTALQNRSIVRVGSNTPRAIDIRLICATNRPIHDMTREGTFRPDLLYRINTVEIRLPPLRERAEDIPELARYFLDLYARKYNRTAKRIDTSAMEKLIAYPWPGNVRELHHALERAVIMSDHERLQPSDFFFASAESTAVSDEDMTFGSYNLDDVEKMVIRRTLARHQGNISRAARELGLTRTSLYRRMEKYGL